MNNYKQLYEKDDLEYKGFYPLTDILSIVDKESGKNLKQLLNQYNHIKLDWKNSVIDTRNSVPLILRHKGLFITYDTGSNIVTEYYNGDDISTSVDAIWQNDINWTKFCSADGYPVSYTKIGYSSERPALPFNSLGFVYYDRTLNKPIWWTGTKWIDAIGADV